jgi:asparagine synthase (glutamine-hydrolysing)
MSGICGFCELGVPPSTMRIEAMLAASSLPGESDGQSILGSAFALGVSQRWPGQEVGGVPGIRVAVDADLHNFEAICNLVSGEHFNAAQLSVSEVLARLYLLRGPDFVHDLEGSFSFALWDERLDQLLLGVDRFGFRVLHWIVEGQRLLFSSRLGSVRAAQQRPTEVNPEAVAQFLLFGVVPAPLTILNGIHRLNPGFLLTFKGGQAVARKYWDLEYPEEAGRSERHWASELREEMRSAVHRHLNGCHPLTTGAYLSGGTDSSSVVAFMSERFKPTQSFSISFPVAGFNEIEFARTTAKRFETQHYEKCLTPEDAAAAIPQLIRYYDEPFANSSAIASYHCAQLARAQGVDTMLAGDGGDELFGGNERYAADKRFALYHSIPALVRRELIEPLARLLPQRDGLVSLPRRYVRRALIPNPRRILSYNLFLNLEPQEIFEPDFLKRNPNPASLAIAEEHFRSAHASSELNRLLYMDVKMTLADNDLRKVNGTAELAGIRVRYPLLDTRLAEFSGRLPAHLKLKGLEKRYIFKQAMKGILPDVVLYKKKHGFGVPLGEWFLQHSRLKSLVQDVLRDPRTRQRGYFRKEFFDQLIRSHEQGHAGFYGENLWYLVALELWHRSHLESVREVTIAN